MRRWKLRAAAAALGAAVTGVAATAPPSAAQEPEPPPAPVEAEPAPTGPAPAEAEPPPPETEAGPAPTDAAGSTDVAPPTDAAPVEAAAAPAVTLDPASGLVDGTAVTMTATGLEPNAFVYASQCTTAAPRRCDYWDNAFGETDAAGNATLTLRVDALLSTGFDDEAPSETDCRPSGVCVITLTVDGGGGPTVVTLDAPLEFSPDSPLAPAPTLTVTPDEMLADRQPVAVSGSGLVWSDSARLIQCATDPAGTGDCDYESQLYLDAADGSFAVDYPVSAVIDTPNGPVDCRIAGSCVLVLTPGGLYSPSKSAVAPLAFDPATVVVPPTLTVTPASGLVDGQRVTVTGSGFRSDYAELYLCPPSPGADDCVWADVFAMVDAAGGFTAQVEVLAIIPTEAGEVDCRTSPEPCLLVAAAGSPTSGRAGRAELAFAADGPVRPAPSITLSPNEDLPDEATVSVTGTNFTSSTWTEVQIDVCRTGDADACDQQAHSRVSPDNAGGFSIDLGVAATFTTGSNETVDCRAAPGCEVVARLGYRGRRATATLAFGPPGVPDDRYLDPVFDEVDVTRDVVYREAVDAAGTPVELAVDIYEPAGDTEAQRPVVVWLHGGWFSDGDKAEMAGYAEAFARRGYVAVSMEYRMRPGLQCCPTDDVAGVTAAILDAHDDAAAGVQWLRDHAAEYRIDPDAIAAGGVSGGATVAFGLAHLPGQMGRTGRSQVAAALPIAGVDLGRADAGEAPVLAFHGAEDRTAPLHLSEWACARAQRVGARCGAVGYGGVWDDVATARQRDIVRRSSDFLAEVVLDPLGYVEWTGPTTVTPVGITPVGVTPVGVTPAAVAASTGPTATTAAPHARGTLPQTGAAAGRLVAIALGLGFVGAALLLARRRRLQPGADRGSLRIAGAATLTAVALVAAGFVVTSNLSSSPSSDDSEEAAGDDHAGHGELDHDTMDHDGEDHNAADHDAADHDDMDHGAMDHGAPDHDAGHAGTGASGHAHAAAGGSRHQHAGGADDPGHDHVGAGDPGHDHPVGSTDPGHHAPGDPGDPGHHPHPPGDPEPPGNGFDPSWTPEQVAYAQGLIDDTTASLVRYSNPAILPLVGYQWIFDGTQPDRYQHWIHLSRIVDQRTIDPDYPESLVFRNGADGPVLEAAMYMLNINYNLANIPPDIAWLPGWHVHDNLCFEGNFRLVGVTVNGVCARGNVVITPPMVHVWAVDTRCGRFAGVDEHGLQCHDGH